MTDKKCPNCKSRSFAIIEYYTADYYYTVEDGIVSPDGMGDYADRVKTTCICSKCGHSWHPKNFDYSVDK